MFSKQYRIIEREIDHSCRAQWSRLGLWWTDIMITNYGVGDCEYWTYPSREQASEAVNAHKRSAKIRSSKWRAVTENEVQS